MIPGPKIARKVPGPPPGGTVLPELLTTREVARACRVHHETVERWRRGGVGPRFLRLGGAIRYDARDLAEFLALAAS